MHEVRIPIFTQTLPASAYITVYAPHNHNH